MNKTSIIVCHREQDLENTGMHLNFKTNKKHTQFTVYSEQHLFIIVVDLLQL